MLKRISLIISILFSVALLYSCGSGSTAVKKEGVSKDKKVTEPEKRTEAKSDYLKQGEILACYFDPHLFSAEFGAAKLISTDEKKKSYEVEWLYNSHATEKGKKAVVKLVITKSHIAEISSLKKGDLVIYGAPNKMKRGIVKEILSNQNKITVEWFHTPAEKINTETADIAIVRVIDQPVMKDPRKK